MAQLVKDLTSAQVMISCFVSSSPASGSVLTAQSLEPALDSVSLSLCPYPAHTLYLSLLKINIKKKKILDSQKQKLCLNVNEQRGLG